MLYEYIKAHCAPDNIIGSVIICSTTVRTKIEPPSRSLVYLADREIFPFDTHPNVKDHHLSTAARYAPSSKDFPLVENRDVNSAAAFAPIFDPGQSRLAQSKKGCKKPRDAAFGDKAKSPVTLSLLKGRKEEHSLGEEQQN